jgi:hypothetical protein
LELHPEKTRPIPFGRYAKASRADAEAEGWESFDFLGLTYIRAKRQGGKCLRKRRIMRKRVRARRAQIAEEMRRRL